MWVSFAVVQLLIRVRLFAIPWTEAYQASLSFTLSWSLPKLMSIDLVILSNYLILCCPLSSCPQSFPECICSIFINTAKHFSEVFVPILTSLLECMRVPCAPCRWYYLIWNLVHNSHDIKVLTICYVLEIIASVAGSKKKVYDVVYLKLLLT